MIKAAFILLISFLLTTFAFAQDAPPPTLAGTYTVVDHGKVSLGYSQSGTLSIAGTGPIYTLALTTDGSSAPAPSIQMLVQGNIGVTTNFPDPSCAPGTLLRQSDGTLFGLWYDNINLARLSMSIEHYTPRSPTTDFAGNYDLVGSYQDGMQYKGTMEVVHGTADNSYRLTTEFTYDETDPNTTYRSRAVGLASASVLGYSTTSENNVACGVSLYTFDDEGNFEGQYDLQTSSSTFSGTRKPG